MVKAVRKTLVYANTGLSSKQIGLTGEILTRLSADGKVIGLVYCGAVLDNCYFNRTHNVPACASCQARQEEITALAGLGSAQRYTLRRFSEAYSFDAPEFKDLDTLLHYQYAGIQIGRGVASSIISYSRDYHVNSTKYGELIDVELRKSINVYLNFKEIIERFRPDEIYLFNGRFSEVWPVVELAKRLRIPFYTMEAGVGTNYEIFENDLPHSIALRHRHIEKYWVQGNSNEREGIGHRWYVNRRKGIETFDKSFTTKQEINLLPSNFDPDRRNIAIFNSSEDELKAIVEWETDLYKFQNEAISKIVELFRDEENFHFYLRVHPNLGAVANIQMQEIEGMQFDNLTIIPPSDPIDTYTLMTACEKVLTFGSSTGIEATYWGKPSILFGKSFYVQLDAVYLPKSYGELQTLLRKEHLAPKPQSNTLKYGYYFATYGTESVNFQLDGARRSRFRGQRLKVIYLRTLVRLLRYLHHIPHWLRLHKIYFMKRFSLWDVFTYK